MSNATILETLYNQLLTVGLPVAVQGADFEKPSRDYWIEFYFTPNIPISAGTEYTATELPRGIATAIICSPYIVDISGSPVPAGITRHYQYAESIAAALPKGFLLDGLTRISQAPYTSDAIKDDEAIRLQVTIAYSR